MLYQLIRQLENQSRSGDVDPNRISIRVFDRQSVAGPGFPHNGRFVQPYHITNMCAAEMSVVYSRPQDFSDWIAFRKSELIDRFPAFKAFIRDPAYHQSGCSHYPRAVMGEYLTARFQDALKTAEDIGTKVTVHTDTEVTNISDNDHAVYLHVHSVKSGNTSRFAADQVLLATGHWPRSGSGAGYFSTPWPAQRLLEQIPRGARVAVIGSSLSAIETALTLSSDGNFARTGSGRLVFKPCPDTRRITMLSRHGLLPVTRAQAIDYHPRFLKQKNLQDLAAERCGKLTLEAIFHLLDQELAVATGQPFEWRSLRSPKKAPMDLLGESIRQRHGASNDNDEVLLQSVIRPILPLVRELYLSLSAAERRRFDREYATLFFAHAATLPLINAEKMLALMEAGTVAVTALGNHYRLVKRPTAQRYEFLYGKQASKRSAFPYVVDARGQERSILTNPCRLIRNLIQNRMIHAGEISEESGSAKTRTHPVEETDEYASASVWIDPGSHRVMRLSPSGVAEKSTKLYAVGAMTRGQMIDVSMARALTKATDRIAQQVVDRLSGHLR